MDTAGFRLRVTAPTASLPPIKRLASLPVEDISLAFDNLRAIYIDPLPPHKPQKVTRKHLRHDASVPDSGYASAEEEDELEDDDSPEESSSRDVISLRSDEFERAHTIRWLTAFTARAPVILPPDDLTASLVDAASSLLASFAHTSDAEPSLTRTFTFPSASGVIEVQLNDAPLLSSDHTSVGLQSWASSIVLAERLCAHPSTYGLSTRGAPTILELGAGTGLLSIAAAKVCPHAHILATDFHPAVLDNLRANVDANAVASTVSVRALDWEHPAWEDGRTVDVVLAADVVYLPAHARWIAACVAAVLKPRGVFWLIVPIRGTGRHEGMSEAVDAVFPYRTEGGDGELVIMELERAGRQDGVGRADEGGYKLYKIGWAGC